MTYSTVYLTNVFNRNFTGQGTSSQQENQQSFHDMSVIQNTVKIHKGEINCLARKLYIFDT